MTIGQALEQIRRTARNGKKEPAGTFGAKVGMSAFQLRQVEQGKRELSNEELDRVLLAFPELGALAFDPNVSFEATEASPSSTDTAEVSTHPTDAPDASDGPSVTSETPAKEYPSLVALIEELEDPDEESWPWTSTMPEALAPVARVPFDADLSTLFVSNSELATLDRCRRKWWLAWYLGLTPRDPGVIYLGPRASGDRVHRALAAWYVPEGEPRQDPRDALERAMTEDWTKIVRALQEAEPDADGVPTAIAKQFEDDTSLERAMIDGYLEWTAETGIDQGLTITHTESYLEAELVSAIDGLRGVDGRPIAAKLIGKIDARAVLEVDGTRRLIDHKSVPDFKSKIRGLPQDRQMMTYHLLEWLNALEGEQCDGALYNMLRKVKRTARATPPFYQREPVRHNITELERFRDRVIGQIRTIADIRYRLESGEDPQAVVWANPTFDCYWECDFARICPMFDDGSRVEDAIQTLFVQHNPLDYYSGAKPSGRIQEGGTIR